MHICIANMALNNSFFRNFSHVVTSCSLVVPSFFCSRIAVGTWIAAAAFIHNVKLYFDRSKNLSSDDHGSCVDFGGIMELVWMH